MLLGFYERYFEHQNLSFKLMDKKLITFCVIIMPILEPRFNIVLQISMFGSNGYQRNCVYAQWQDITVCRFLDRKRVPV